MAVSIKGDHSCKVNPPRIDTLFHAMEAKRSRNAAARLGHVPLSMGTEPLFLQARVLAPYEGSSVLYPGRVNAVHPSRKRVHVIFDDGDEDFNVKIGTMKHEAGAQASCPRKRRHGAAGVIKIRSPKPVLRLSLKHANTAAPPVQLAEPDWVHHGLIAVKFVPPKSGQLHYEDLAQRLVFSFRWLYVGEHHAEHTPFPPNRIGQITLQGIVNAKPHVSGMHAVALRHWLVDLAQGPPILAVTAANIFGSFDPALH